MIFYVVAIFSLLFHEPQEQNFCFFVKFTKNFRARQEVALFLKDTISEQQNLSHFFVSDIPPQLTFDTKKLDKVLKKIKQILNLPQLKSNIDELKNVTFYAKQLAATDLYRVSRQKMAFLFKALGITEFLLGRKNFAKKYLFAYFNLQSDVKENEFLYSTDIKLFAEKVKKEFFNLDTYYKVPLSVTPSSSFIIVDFDSTIKASSELNLKPGFHTLIFIKDGYYRKSFIIDPEDYSEMGIKLVVKLKKLPWYKKFKKHQKQLFRLKGTSKEKGLFNFFKKIGCNNVYAFKITPKKNLLKIKALRLYSKGAIVVEKRIKKDQKFSSQIKNLILDLEIDR